jgi:two-component system, NarL family, invasion response regulator UvrY
MDVPLKFQYHFKFAYMGKITVMIVDDHTLIRETWSFLLGRNENFEVIAEVGDGQKAIDIARDKRPNIVLLDINMTPLNGFDVLKMIRKQSPGSKVIAVSMHSQPAYAKKMLRMGAKGYVTKNSPRQEMLDAILDVNNGNTYICQEVKNILSDQMLSEEDNTAGLNQLSEREIEVINQIRDGLSSKEIADRLAISIKTVEVHRHNILKKLKVKNTASLINYINSSGL